MSLLRTSTHRVLLRYASSSVPPPHRVELLPVAWDPPMVVVAVLPAAGGVGADRLDVTVRVRTDPDVLPCRWDGEIADALQRVRVGDRGATLVAIAETAATAHSRD